MTKKYLQLNALNVYKTAFNLSNFVWDVVIKWDFQHLTGYEVPVRSSCNGSLKECFDWNQKSKKRKLLSDKEYDYIFGELQKLPKGLNQLIQFTNQKLTI